MFLVLAADDLELDDLLLKPLGQFVELLVDEPPRVVPDLVDLLLKMVALVLEVVDVA